MFIFINMVVAPDLTLVVEYIESCTYMRYNTYLLSAILRVCCAVLACMTAFLASSLASLVSRLSEQTFACLFDNSLRRFSARLSAKYWCTWWHYITSKNKHYWQIKINTLENFNPQKKHTNPLVRDAFCLRNFWICRYNRWYFAVRPSILTSCKRRQSCNFVPLFTTSSMTLAIAASSNSAIITVSAIISNLNKRQNKNKTFTSKNSNYNKHKNNTQLPFDDAERLVPSTGRGTRVKHNTNKNHSTAWPIQTQKSVSCDLHVIFVFKHTFFKIRPPSSCNALSNDNEILWEHWSSLSTSKNQV